MFKLSWRDAISAGAAAQGKWPGVGDPRLSDGRLFPNLSPKFHFEPGSKVFTIGSCFARHIEEKLPNFDLPTRRFSVPREEWPFRPNGVLNEYNPGTMAQRIVAAVEATGFDDRAIGEASDGLLSDLLLVANAPVSKTRLLERRSEIDAVYSEIKSSDVVIITLGLVEAWYDKEHHLYLNQWPWRSMAQKHPGRFELRILDGEDAFDLLGSSLSALIASGIQRVLLTVSPVPLNTTFSGRDCVSANTYSKAVLRVCAERLAREFSEVDYFPSFEIATSGGMSSFDEDLVHVKDDVVGAIIDYMLAAYIRQGLAEGE